MAKDQDLTDAIYVAADAFISSVTTAKGAGLHVTLDMHDGEDDDEPTISIWVDRPLRRSKRIPKEPSDV